MNKKTASMVAYVLLSTFVTMCFMPIMLIEEYWKADMPGVGVYSHYTSNDSLVSLVELKNNFLIYIVVVTLIMSIVGLVLQYSGKEDPIIDKLNFMPVISLALLIIFLITYLSGSIPNGTPAGTASSGYYGYYTFSFGWGMYIGIAIMIVGSIISLLIGKE